VGDPSGSAAVHQSVGNARSPDLSRAENGECSSAVLRRVENARAVQQKRLKREPQNPHDKNALAVWIRARTFIFFTSEVQPVMPTAI
jgi:hypothetical protein